MGDGRKYNPYGVPSKHLEFGYSVASRSSSVPFGVEDETCGSRKQQMAKIKRIMLKTVNRELMT